MMSSDLLDIQTISLVTFSDRNLKYRLISEKGKNSKRLSEITFTYSELAVDSSELLMLLKFVESYKSTIALLLTLSDLMLAV